MTSDGKFFYTNALEVAASSYDVNLKFMRNGTSTGASSDASPVIELKDEITVAMSPAHAKAMLPSLLRIVLEYEKHSGAPIALPNDMQKLWDETFKSLS